MTDSHADRVDAARALMRAGLALFRRARRVLLPATIGAFHPGASALLDRIDDVLGFRR